MIFYQPMENKCCSVGFVEKLIKWIEVPLLGTCILITELQ